MALSSRGMDPEPNYRLPTPPPASDNGAALDVENAVIGSMLIDRDCVPFVLGKVSPSDFASDRNRSLFAGARMLYTAGKGVDALTILGAIGKSEDKELRQYCAELMEITPTSANVREYVEILKEQSQLRRIHAVASTLYNAATLDECAKPMRELGDIYGTGQALESKTLFNMLVEFAERMENNQPREYIGIGFKEIDENTFMEKGDVMVIGGAPSDGKTALALKAALEMSKTQNVGFYSLETRHRKLIDRIVASAFNIDFGAIKRSQLSGEDWMRFEDGLEAVSKRRLTVTHAGGLTVDQLTSNARAWGFDVIFIDYVQLITPTETRNVPRHEQIAEISRTLHTFAQNTGTLVVELAQLSRKERQTKREYDMFDLGESSQLEKDADIVLLLYRPPNGTRFIEGDKDSEELDPDKTRILRIAKQKEGKRVRLPLVFDGEHQDFSVMAENTYRAIRRASREAQKKGVVDGGVQQFITLPKSEEGDMPF